MCYHFWKYDVLQLFLVRPIIYSNPLLPLPTNSGSFNVWLYASSWCRWRGPATMIRCVTFALCLAGLVYWIDPLMGQKMSPCGLSIITAVAFGILCLILTAGANTDLAEEKYGVKYASKCEGNWLFWLPGVTFFLLQTVNVFCAVYA